MCSWYEASARASKGETCADQMTDSFQAHKDAMQLLSQARALRSWVCCLQIGTAHAIPVFVPLTDQSEYAYGRRSVEAMTSFTFCGRMFRESKIQL